jgi:hypothetical protein
MKEQCPRNLRTRNRGKLLDQELSAAEAGVSLRSRDGREEGVRKVMLLVQAGLEGTDIRVITRVGSWS